MLKLEIRQLLRSELLQRHPGMKVAYCMGGGRPTQFAEKRNPLYCKAPVG